MARPLNDNRRKAVLNAAMTLIAEVGLGASTADIAKRAGVSSGSVFTYFETKVDLLNALYLDLKAELVEAVHAGWPSKKDSKAQLRHVWLVWTQWGATNPAKRRAVQHLTVSDLVSATSRQEATKMAAPTIELIAKISESGALHDAPPRYVTSVVETLVETTTDFMIASPKDAKKLSQVGFDALWNMLT